MTTVIDAVSDGADPERITRTVYGSSYIEVDEDELRMVSPHLRFSRGIQDRLNRLGHRLIWDR